MRFTQRVEVGSDELVAALTNRQFVRPHETLGEAVREVFLASGVCPGAGEQALEWLKLDVQQPIGRLRRSEIAQLARSAHRYWMDKVQNAAVASGGE